MAFPLREPDPLVGTGGASLWATAASARTIESLQDPVSLEEAALRLGALVRELGCSAVVAASPVGQRLALVVASKTTLPVWTPTSRPAGRVAVLDAAVNSGVNLVRVMRTVRETGADDVVGVALLAQRIAVSAWHAEGELIAALEEI